MCNFCMRHKVEINIYFHSKDIIMLSQKIEYLYLYPKILQKKSSIQEYNFLFPVFQRNKNKIFALKFPILVSRSHLERDIRWRSYIFLSKLQSFQFFHRFIWRNFFGICHCRIFNKFIFIGIIQTIFGKMIDFENPRSRFRSVFHKSCT